ncbi:penicillin acylase family protein [uncultured Shewanella sp.]|uniref:penicillin acylase family protein n=1 Tax=uncultured Shewanella sp. TaxID=173975 RepID=UPI0026125824|nr:penicillin acylase family protein [uncultured Shewanella sp.]
MMKRFKYSVFVGLFVLLILFMGLYACLRLSLPQLDGVIAISGLNEDTVIERDRLGTAVISGNNRLDLSYALGFSHGQDRFFQMDLLRRNAAGELSELFGSKSIELDKRNRIHQFKAKAKAILSGLSSEEKSILFKYAQGVNAALKQQVMPSFEYLLLKATPQLWQAADSLLVIFSMYLDLQSKTIERDLVLTLIKQHFNQEVVDFLIQPSQFQAALDLSRIPLIAENIPILAPNSVQNMSSSSFNRMTELPQKGSNNWAVSGNLTQTGQAMLSNDMHLSLSVPIIWYRVQLNYPDEVTQQLIQITGVSLPGTPGVIVGSNGHIAWGFTNAYLDTADWVELSDNTAVTMETEQIKVRGDDTVNYQFELSQYGPVISTEYLVKQHEKEDNDVAINESKKYALSWVAHQDYAVNFNLLGLEKVQSVEEAMALAPSIGIPIQNMLVVDDKGSIAWQPTGAFPSRNNPQNTAMRVEDYQLDLWQQDYLDLPQRKNPAIERLWTANARAVSVDDDHFLGDGGYALGARNVQIYERLMSSELFSEDDFYQLQRDNQAHFLLPWQRYLLTLLSEHSNEFEADIEFIRAWRACACEDSVGYTLVSRFREAFITQLFSPIENKIIPYGQDLSVIKRYLEPGAWQLLTVKPLSWLPKDETWNDIGLLVYKETKQYLLKKHSERYQLSDLTWGQVNRLNIQHPFSRIFPFLSPLLDMPSASGFGDDFMPAVQRAHFGASERFIVQPGQESRAILTLPGGQSGHPLSVFYRSGYEAYINNDNTPLLPQQLEYKLILSSQ